MAGFPPSMAGPPPGDPSQGGPPGNLSPGMPPGGPPGGGNPLAALAQKGGGSSGSLLQLILTFLAGAGLPHVLDSGGKLISAMRGGKGGMGKPGAGAPPPQGGPPPGANPQAIQQQLQMLAQRGGQ